MIIGARDSMMHLRLGIVPAIGMIVVTIIVPMIVDLMIDTTAAEMIIVVTIHGCMTDHGTTGSRGERIVSGGMTRSSPITKNRGPSWSMMITMTTYWGP